MKIGILQTGLVPDELASDHGEYPEMFEALLSGRGFQFQTYNVLTDEVPTSAELADGWLITGSKYGAYEDHDWIKPLENLIRDIYAKKIPLIGVCFGHQIIAQALGGKVEKFKGGWRVGHTEYNLNGFDNPIPLNAWHQDQVVEIPACAKVVGSNDFCKYAMLTYGDTILTTQPHPEYDHAFIQGLMKYRGVGVVPEVLLREAKNNYSHQLQPNLLADMFVNIFNQTHV